MARTERLAVTGMTCGGCEQAVMRALGRLPGVSEVKASHTAREVVVTFDDASISLDRIQDGITALGYAVA